MAFGNKPTDPSFAFDTDITKYVRKLSYKRGRNMILNVVEAGTGALDINDTTRRFDPNNTASPYYPNIQPMKPIQMKIGIAGGTYTVMTQFVERWPRKRTGYSYAERNLTTIDGFDLLSLFGLAGKSYVQQLSGSLIAAILSDASWPTGLRNIAAGQSLIDSTGTGNTFTTTDTTKALQFIQQIVGPGGESGIFFIDGQGRATFLDRHTMFGPPFSTSQATFTDTNPLTGEFQYTDIQPSIDKDLIVDDWIGQRALGTIQEALDSTSISNYGRRTQTVTSLLTTDGETQSAMQYLLAIYKNPVQRVTGVTIKPGRNAELWIQCLSREIGDRITIKEHPPGGGAADVRDYVIQGIEATFDIGPVTSAVYTWSLFPASSGGFVLDDTSLGVLDVSLLSF